MNRKARFAESYSHRELKHARRCPFCGSEHLALCDDAMGPIIPGALWRVFCASCGVRGPLASTRDMAVNHWNGEFDRPISGTYIAEDLPEGGGTGG
jgi:Lar family restriction alleviation protein